MLYAMKIAIDIDDVLVEFVPSLARWYNDKFGTNLKKEDFYTFAFHEIWGGTHLESVGKVRKFLDSGIIKDLNVIEGAAEVLKELDNKGHELHIVTSRFPDLHEDTLIWLDRHFKGIFKEVHFGHNKISKQKDSLSKAERCKQLDIDLLIDDLPEHALECAKKGIRVLLFDAPWNQDIKENKKIKRVCGWGDVLKEINLLRV